MLKILNKVEGAENASQPSVYTRRVLNKKLVAATGLILAILVVVVGLNYFNILPISQKLPLLSFLPTSSGTSSCKIVLQEYCSLGELIDYTDAQGKKWTDIGFRLPKDTPVYSPMTGQATRSQILPSSDAVGFSVGISNVDDPNTITYSLLGDLRFDTEKGTINEGEIVGHIAGTGAKSFGEYDLIVTARQGGTTASILKELFPQAFEKPAKKVTP